MFLLAVVFQFPAVTPRIADRLEAGEIVIEMRMEDGMPVGTSTGLIGATPDRTWALMIDFDRYSKFYTGVPRSEVRRRAGRNIQVMTVIDFPWPMPDKWCLEEFQLDEESRTFSWRRLDGNVKRYHGRAKFSPWPGGRTLMQVDAGIDPGFPFLPQWLLSYFAAHSLPGIVSGPRDYLQRTAKAAP